MSEHEKTTEHHWRICNLIIMETPLFRDFSNWPKAAIKENGMLDPPIFISGIRKSFPLKIST